jgi:hypothetical protein
MKKIGFVKLFILFVCFASLNVFGQQRREISKQEFLDAYQKAGEKTKTFAVRLVSKSERYSGGKVQSTENFTSESIPPDKNHTITEIKRFDADKSFSIERILIGGDEYKRESGGDWTRRNFNEVGKTPNPISSKAVENSSKYYLTENAQFGNQTANLYELSVENKITIPSRNGAVREFVSYRKEKRWISRDGRLLKMELEDESGEAPKNVSRRVWTYEYDPNIKIEAPQMSSPEKK